MMILAIIMPFMNLQINHMISTGIDSSYVKHERFVFMVLRYYMFVIAATKRIFQST
jgi:hypothetical protein